MSRRQAKQLVVSSDVDRRSLQSKTLEDGVEKGTTFDDDVMAGFWISGRVLISLNGATGNK
jgi:hypothetical protein